MSEGVSKRLLVRQPTKLIFVNNFNCNKNMDNLNLVVGLPIYYLSCVSSVTWAFSSENTLFMSNKFINHNYNKIVKSDWLSTALICNGNRTEWSPIRSVIIRVINKIGRPRTRMITDRIGLHSVLLPLQIL